MVHRSRTLYTHRYKSTSPQAWRCEVPYRRAHVQLYIQIRTYSQSKTPSFKEDLNVEPENFSPVTFCQRRMCNSRNGNLICDGQFLPQSISELLEELGLSQTRFPSSISRCLIRIHVKPSRQSSRTTFRFHAILRYYSGIGGQYLANCTGSLCTD